jgi:hypothetical protein
MHAAYGIEYQVYHFDSYGDPVHRRLFQCVSILAKSSVFMKILAKPSVFLKLLAKPSVFLKIPAKPSVFLNPLFFSLINRT